jgi:hypothetical protein
MSPALIWWIFLNVTARAWSIPAPKPEKKEEA